MTGDVPIQCPGCHQEMWRPDHRVKIEAGTPNAEGTWSVCRQCSGIWSLSVSGRWRKPTARECRELSEFPVLFAAALKFAAIRDLEAAYPGWLARAERRSKAEQARETKH